MHGKLRNLWMQKSVEISRFLHITILEPETGYFTSICYKIPTDHAFFYPFTRRQNTQQQQLQ